MNSKQSSSNQNSARTGSAPNICLPLDDKERLCWLGHICHHCPLHSWHLAAMSLRVPGAMIMVSVNSSQGDADLSY